MHTFSALVFFFFLILDFALSRIPKSSYDYCVVGAGPAGIQMGHFLQKAGRDYIILEKCAIAGCFFRQYPRHRTLISINKRFTGQKNRDFNERHDWNSLLTEDLGAPRFTQYSEKLFPHADDLVKYLNDFSEYFNLNIAYNQKVARVSKILPENVFQVEIQNLTADNEFEKEPTNIHCRYMLMATGMSSPIRPFWATDKVYDYTTMSMDLSDYTNKTVLILGSGNGAFETANHIKDTAGVIYILTRASEVPLSFQTHYVGHVRAFNLQFLDLYQLKSLGAIINEVDVDAFELLEFNDTLNQWVSKGRDEEENSSTDTGWKAELMESASLMDLLNWESSEMTAELGFDTVISCMGWTMDRGFFNETTQPEMKNSKYPDITDKFESVNQPNMFFLGTNAHSYDKDSSGGFIHGFRYQVRVLHNILEQRHHGVQWPRKHYSANLLLLQIVKRINTSPGLYQMFHTLCDVIVEDVSPNQISARAFSYFQDYPIKLLGEFEKVAGVRLSPETKVLVWFFDYGPKFSCVGCNTLSPARVQVNRYTPEASNFIHPVFYQFQYGDVAQKKETFKKLVFGVTEHPIARWLGKSLYVDPVAEFIYATLNVKTSVNYDSNCMLAAIEGNELDKTCPDEFHQAKFL